MPSRIQSNAVQAITSWDRHNIVLATDTNWLNAGWPWFVGEGFYEWSDFYDAETRTVTTYNGDPTVTTAWSGGFPATSYVDYGAVPLHDPETVTVEARFKIGLDFVTEFGSAFPTDQNVLVEWTEVETDGSNVIDRTAQSAAFAIAASDTEFHSSDWINVSIPATSGNFISPAGALRNPPLTVIVNRDTGRRWKEGHYAYTRPGFPPVVYRREDCTGFLPACGASASETYDGHRKYIDEETTDDQRSADAIEREYFSTQRGQTWPDLPAISPTVSFRNLSFRCLADGTTKEAGVTLELSQEADTQEIYDWTVAEVAPGTASTGLETYTDNGAIGHDWKPVDETMATLCESNYRLRCDIAGLDEPEDGSDFDVSATLARINMETGEITSETVSATLTYTSPDPLEDATDRVGLANEQEWLWLHSLNVTTAAQATRSEIFQLTAATTAIKL